MKKFLFPSFQYHSEPKIATNLSKIQTNQYRTILFSNCFSCRHLRMQSRQKQWEQLGKIPKRCLADGCLSQMVSMQIPHDFSLDRAIANDTSMSALCFSIQFCRANKTRWFAVNSMWYKLCFKSVPWCGHFAEPHLQDASSWICTNHTYPHECRHTLQHNDTRPLSSMGTTQMLTA